MLIFCPSGKHLMWRFFGTKGNPRSSRRISELEERMDTLERKLRMNDLEYNEFYEKTRHMMGRIAKRSAILEKAQHEEPAPDSLTQDPQEAGFTDALEGLSPRQRQLNAQILAGRRRM